MDPRVPHCLANFAIKFCNELDKNKTSVCSPLSTETVLALVALGCKNQARAELLKALDNPDDDTLRTSFGYLNATLQSIKGATLNMANKVYLQKGGTLKPGIKKDAKEMFEFGLEQLDFKEKEAAADVINKWVAEKTNSTITDIVSAEMFKEETRLVLVNAIYFQGDWEVPFRKKRTKYRDFHVNNTTTIKVLQMCMRSKYYFYAAIPELKAQLLQMDYRGGESSMVIILPDEVEGLNSVLQQLAGRDLMADIQDLRYTRLDVQIPKFKVETTIDLKELLPKLGIKSIFDEETSDIDMLTSNERLFVSEAIQKAFIVVDEVGTKAGACTMIPIEMPCSIQRHLRFIADRPFIYLLMAQKIPLFIGVYEGSEFSKTSKGQDS